MTATKMVTVTTMATNLIVGAGLSGAALARLIAEKAQQKVLVIDSKEHLAGNCHDYRDAESGIMVHTYGSHIFHTNDHKVWDFLRRFTSFNQYMHWVEALIDGIHAPVPFNLNSLHAVFPATLANRLEQKLLDTFPYNRKVPIFELQREQDKDLQFLADYIYEKVFLHYTAKQWGRPLHELDRTVAARVPVYISRDNRYFQDVYQGIPEIGYSEMVARMLDHPNIELRLATSCQQLAEQSAACSGGERSHSGTGQSELLKLLKSFDRIFYSGPIDEFFDYEFGELPYRSVRFELTRYPKEYLQAGAVVNYPCNYDFTRMHEYKYYLDDRANCTLVAKEYSEAFQRGVNERYYPIPSEQNHQLYQRYLAKSVSLGGGRLHFFGRLGDYRYYNMDQAVARSMGLFAEIFEAV